MARARGSCPGLKLFNGGAVSDEWAELVNALPSGWVRTMGLTITHATADEVSCEWEVGPEHHQGYGIVHGGVHCGVIETLASIGAAIVARDRGQLVAGLENNTSFIRAVRSGRLHATARPISLGRSSQVWEATIHDDREKVVATGRVRLLCFAPETPLGGAPAGGQEAGQAG